MIANLVSSETAAMMLGLTPATLACWRSEGKGPVYRKHGRTALYDVDDIEKWSKAQSIDPSIKLKEKKVTPPEIKKKIREIISNMPPLKGRRIVR